MKKSDRTDRPQRARIPVKKEKKDPWRDAPKEEILARGKKSADRLAAAPHAKKKEAGGGERTERPQQDETRGKKDFGGERAGKRDEGRRDDRGSFKKPGFKKDDSRSTRKDGERDAPARPRKMAKGFGEEVKGERGERKTFNRRDDRSAGDRQQRGENPFTKKPRRDDRREDSRPPRGEKPFSNKPRHDGSADDKRPPRAEGAFPRKPRRGDDRERGQAPRSERPFPPKRQRDDDRDARAQRDVRPTRAASTKKARKEEDDEDDEAAPVAASGPMTLNKYLAHAGLSSRRDAATAIKEGKVKVNGEVLLTPGYRVQPDDKVTFEGKAMKPQTKKVYVLLNKPKGFITTTDDEMDRRTVMELVQSVEAERLYPVGRLDRNTTGLLLMTNDGDLAQRLTHPKYEAKKIYQVGLDKPLTKGDFEKLLAGVELEDGIAKPDKLSFLETPSELGLEIHSGRNRIVRRMFEALGYEVEKLDRVMFAGLTKKNIPRGQWRHLTEEEVVRLKHFKT